MTLFLSTFTNKIDRKGRVSVPAPWRSALSAQTFAGVVCLPSFTDPCLEGLERKRLELYSAALDQQYDIFSPEQSDAARLLFSLSKELPWDTEGRILLPEDFLSHAAIVTEAVFVGCGEKFQIWEPGAYRAMIEDTRQRIKEKGLKLRAPTSSRLSAGDGPHEQ